MDVLCHVATDRTTIVLCEVTIGEDRVHLLGDGRVNQVFHGGHVDTRAAHPHLRRGRLTCEEPLG